MSARDSLDDLYDRAAFLLLKALVREIAQLRGEVEALRRALDVGIEAGE